MKTPILLKPAARPDSALGEQDIHLFREGTHSRLHEKLGCHLEATGARFALWAPNARAVSVIGDFNDWNAEADQARLRDDGSGIWEREVRGVQAGHRYKFLVHTQAGARLEKADPFAFRSEAAPATASIAWSLDGHDWADAAWMAGRATNHALNAPMSVYEVHLGSWRRDKTGEMLDYRSMAPLLTQHVKEMGFTHVELMPITEHPFYGSWGYQTTGYFAATSRYGTPQDFKCLVDTLHQAGIGVILDWVPSHFPADAHGLAQFDGTHLYEHADPRQGFHPEWNSSIFNYGRNEVRSFLLSSAMFWLGEYHIDALRVDAVASMLYLDYSRKEGEWIPNVHGGRENLEAIAFLRQLNESAYRDHPGVQVIAEESTAWPMVSRPTWVGGLGFGMKWNMGWMHDTLSYMHEDPIHRRWHHGELTFSLAYAFNENFMLPLSHDEVVHGKGSLIEKMPGDDWQKFANLRLLYGHMWAHPGKKLLFMGCEFGQRREWNHDSELDWGLIDGSVFHGGLQRWVSDLNRLYRSEPALHELDFDAAGFEWVDGADAESSVVSYLRKSGSGEALLVVANFTPMPRENHLVGVPAPGRWRELLNSDAAIYGGSGVGNQGGVDSVPVAAHGRFQALNLRLPPLGVLVLKLEGATA
ncbi:MAG: 1,4-alpha-glucan branching protein GlgB [Hydrogenophaga sp.]|uniref:1,4-alpha-glucan branching protein GlgB n=1 Tax=Hydrogenophaga sp. TaxID=1904254 RepID=UPI00261DCB35|nr:1,4-alpha-glucan branching protein GlgB [Hydrogenophaga sp.]MDM7941375.1 1,4-alpha-glucan branching protein GlgB [Hydrogenophaga sp.]